MALDGRLRDDLQATAADDAAWISFLSTLGQMMGATEVVLGGGFGGKPGTFFAPTTTPADIDLYRQFHHQQNALMQAVVSRPSGTISHTEEMVQFETFRHSDFYNLWCVPQGFQHGTAVSFSSSGGWMGAMVVNSEAPLGTQPMGLLEELTPLIQAGVERWAWLGQLRSANRLTLDTLDTAGLGALVLDRMGEVLDCNATATAMLVDGRLTISGKRIRSLDPSSDAALWRLIGRGLAVPETAGGRVQILGNAGPLVLQCGPFPGAMAYPAAQRPALIAIVTDPQQRIRQRLADLRSKFGLTMAEAEMAMAVVETGSRKAAALARGVSDTTARSQLTSIFDKTGVRRQTELVRLLMDDV